MSGRGSAKTRRPIRHPRARISRNKPPLQAAEAPIHRRPSLSSIVLLSNDLTRRTWMRSPTQETWPGKSSLQIVHELHSLLKRERNEDRTRAVGDRVRSYCTIAGASTKTQASAPRARVLTGSVNSLAGVQSRIRPRIEPQCSRLAAQNFTPAVARLLGGSSSSTQHSACRNRVTNSPLLARTRPPRSGTVERPT